MSIVDITDVDAADAAEVIIREARRRQRRRRWTILIVALIAAAGVVVFASGGDSSPIRPQGRHGGAAQPDAANSPTVAMTCGTQLPRAVRVPDGYSGPTPTPSPGATATAAPGQLVLSWASGTSSIEARWPADAETIAQFQVLLPSPATEPVSGLPITPTGGFGTGPGEIQHTPNGLPYNYLFMSFPAFAPAGTPSECATLQLSVYDADETAVGNVLERLTRRPFISTAPLIASSVDIDTAPTAAACPVPAGTPPSPNAGNPTPASDSYATATHALRAFLHDRLFLPDTGYVQMNLPDGSIAFGAKAPHKDIWVTVVRVVPTNNDAWTVESWDASGC